LQDLLNAFKMPFQGLLEAFKGPSKVFCSPFDKDGCFSEAFSGPEEGAADWKFFKGLLKVLTNSFKGLKKPFKGLFKDL
jgi:hypothetical protein